MTDKPKKETFRGAAIWALKEGIELLRAIRDLQSCDRETGLVIVRLLSEIRNFTRSIDDTMHKFLEELVQYQEMNVKKISPIVYDKGEIARILNEADAEEKLLVDKSQMEIENVENNS